MNTANRVDPLRETSMREKVVETSACESWTEGGTAELSSSEHLNAPTSGGSTRKLTEEVALLAGSEVLKATFNYARNGFMWLDGQLRVRSFNPRLSELIGFPPGVIFEGATGYSLVSASVALGHYPGSSVEEAYGLWSKRLADRTPGHHYSRSSSGRTMKIGLSPYSESDWIITYEDVSARVNAEKALAEQNERFDICLTNIPVGVCMFDAEMRLIVCNSS